MSKAELRATMMALLVGVALAAGIVSVAAVVRSSHDTCTQVNALRVALTQVLTNSERGLPSNPYFKKRPAELRAAEAQVAYDLSLFKPVPC